MEFILKVLVVDYIAGRKRESTIVEIGLREVIVQVHQFFQLTGLRACFIRHPEVREANLC